MNTEIANSASPAQHKFIASLLAERELPQSWRDRTAELYARGDVDGAKAHQMIDAMLDRPKLAARKPVVEGYHLLDGTVWKVQRAVHTSGQLYAKRLVVDADGNGSFEHVRGGTKGLSEDTLMTASQAADLGKLYSCCVRCGRTLTDEESIARGMGPVCASKW